MDTPLCLPMLRQRLHPETRASCPHTSMLTAQTRAGVRGLASDAKQTPEPGPGMYFQWPSHLRSRRQAAESPRTDAQRDAAAAALSKAEPVSAAVKTASDVPAVVEHAIAEDIVSGRQHEPPASGDKRSIRDSDGHSGAGANSVHSGVATVAAIECAAGTEVTATAAATESAEAADDAADQVVADAAALVVVPAIADPASLVDFHFNTRRGEPRVEAPLLCCAHTVWPSAASPGRTPARVSRLRHRCCRGQQHVYDTLATIEVPRSKAQ